MSMGRSQMPEKTMLMAGCRLQVIRANIMRQGIQAVTRAK